MKSFFSSRLCILITGFCLFLVLLVLLLPTLASTDWGKRQLNALINFSIPGRLEIRKLNLKWRKGQSIEGVLLYDPQGNPVLGFDKFFTEATLWQLLNRSTHLGHVQLLDLNASIVTDEKGISNLQYALGLATEESSCAISSSTILLSDINVDSYLFTKQEPFSIHITGFTHQGDLTGSFKIEASLKELTSNHWEELGQAAQNLLSIEGSKDVKLQAKIINFPVDLLDCLLALKKPNFNRIFHTFLGDKINLTIDKEPSEEGVGFQISLLAPLLQGNARGEISQGQFSLREPATFYFNFIPSLVNTLTDHHLQLLEPTRLNFTLEKFSFPLAFLNSIQSQDDLSKFELKAQTYMPSASMILPSSGKMEVLDLKVFFDSSAHAKTLMVQIQGQAQQDQNLFDFCFDSKLGKPSRSKNLLEQIKNGGEFSLKAHHFPLKVLNFYSKDQLNELVIGSHANFEVMAKHIESDAFDLVVSLETPHVKMDQAHFKIGAKAIEGDPFTAEYLVSPLILKYLIGSENFVLQQPCSLWIQVQELHFPLANPLKGSIQAHLSAQHIQISDLVSQNLAQLQNLQLQLKGQPLLDLLTARLSTQATLTDPKGYPLSILGNQIDLNLSSQLNINLQHGLEISQFKTECKTPEAEISLVGKITPDNQLILTAPLEIRYQLQPKILETWNIINQHQLKLHNSPRIYFSTEPFQLKLKEIDLETLAFKGMITIDCLDLKDALNHLSTIEQIEILYTMDTPQNVLQIDLSGIAYTSTNQRSKSSQLSAHFLIQSWLNQGKYDLTHVKMEAITHLIGIPTSLMSVVTSQDLAPFLGPTIDIELKTLVDRQQQSPGYWDMNIDSSLLHAKARIKFDEALTLYESPNYSAEFRWTLTPEGYQLLKLGSSSSHYPVLLEPVVLKGLLSHLYIPLKNKDSWLDGGSFDADFITNETKWKESVNSSMVHSLKMITSLQSKNLIDHLSFRVEMRSEEKPILLLNGLISHWLDQTQQVNLKQASLDAKLETQQFPIALIHLFHPSDSSYSRYLSAFIGDYLNTQAYIQLHHLDGSLAGQMQGSRGHISLDSQLNKGVLVLNHPLIWEGYLTPELSQAFLSKNVPFFSTAFASEKPIRIIIDPQDFSFPLIPFNSKDIHLEKGIIHLGKIHFRNEGEIKTILNWLKPISSQAFTIWFTPLHFNIAQGKFILQRLDMLVANTYHLASWGKMDLNSYKLDMILGLSGQSLHEAFNISGLSPDDMLQIPIKGKKGKIKIDKKKATARLSAVVAQAQESKEGKLIGSILKLASHDDSKPPAPITQPFPWQSVQLKDNTESIPQIIEQNSEKKTTKKHKQRSDDLIKEIEKKASSILLDLIHK